MKTLFLILSIVFVVIGLGVMPLQGSIPDIVEGLAKGLAGVFFILYYILMLLGKEPTDSTTH